jgi:hypothetical protein
MAELPMEIWTLIFGFLQLEDEYLYRMMGVNRILYQLVLDRKYRKVCLDLRKPAGMKHAR